MSVGIPVLGVCVGVDFVCWRAVQCATARERAREVARGKQENKGAAMTAAPFCFGWICDRLRQLERLHCDRVWSAASGQQGEERMGRGADYSDVA